MKNRRCLSIFFLAACCFPGNAPHADESPRVGRTVDNFELPDAFGRTRSLTEFADKQALVVVFIGTQCPISNRYIPDLNRLQDDYTTHGVQLLAINASPLETAASVARHRREYGIRFPVLRDPHHVAARQFDARRTPQAFILDRRRVMRYNGRVDDRLGYTHNRPEARRNDLAEALEEVLAGREVSRPILDCMGCVIPRDIEPPEPREARYHRDIAPILQSHCQECHRPNGAGPMTFMNYRQARAWGPMMVETVLAGRMPPWKADPRWGEFSNAPTITSEEIDTLNAWVKNGMAEGDPEDAPPPRDWPGPEEWQIGEPDLVLQMPRECRLPAQGLIEYIRMNMTMGLTEDKWIKAVEIRPGNPRAVHHILTYCKTPEGLEDQRDVAMGLESNLLEGYVPGHRPRILEDGMARKIPAGSRLYWVLHYQATGKPETDRSKIGFVFADGPQPIEVKYGGAYNTEFFLAPHAKNVEVTAEKVFQHDAVLLGFAPHMHYRGRNFRYELIRPNGKREILLHVDDYDINWQQSYLLTEPIEIPAAGRLFCTAHMDNSADNPRNPNPNQPVWWGEQSFGGEMMVGYFMFHWKKQQPIPEDQADRKMPSKKAKHE